MYVGTKTQQRKSFSESLFICDTHGHTCEGNDGKRRCVERAGGVCKDNKCQHNTARKLSEASVCCLLVCLCCEEVVKRRRGRMFEEKRLC